MEVAVDDLPVEYAGHAFEQIPLVIVETDPGVRGEVRRARDEEEDGEDASTTRAARVLSRHSPFPEGGFGSPHAPPPRARASFPPRPPPPRRGRRGAPRPTPGREGP